jgi:predicted phage terminase large subunit-like protein
MTEAAPKILGQNGWEDLPKSIPWNSYIKVKPTAKQLAFCMLTCQEAFYGGAAGGGKSVALLAAALQYVCEPKYAAVLFRRTFSDLSLPGALMDKAHEWLDGTDAHWRDASSTWEFPSGATLTFGYLDSARDKFRYQSAEFQFVGFDELTQFQELDYRYLFSRLRRLKDSPVPIRMRAASNPGNLGHEWVKERFVTNGKRDRRPFIPARLRDNPYLDQEAYLRSLAELDPITRAQYLSGDWDVHQGGNKFDRAWFALVDEAPKGSKFVRFWDLAATDPKPGKDPDWTVGALMALSPERVLYIADIKRMRGSPGAVEQFIKATAQVDGTAIPIRMEQEPGSSGIKVIDDYQKRTLMGYNFQGVKSTGDKEVRANPLASQSFSGNVKLVRAPWNETLLSEFELFPNGSHDDQVDACSGALSFLSATSSFDVWAQVVEIMKKKQEEKKAKEAEKLG